MLESPDRQLCLADTYVTTAVRLLILPMASRPFESQVANGSSSLNYSRGLTLKTCLISLVKPLTVAASSAEDGMEDLLEQICAVCR